MGVGYHRGVRVLFILDPLERLELAGDTSFGLMLEAATRGWDVWTCQIGHLGLVGDDAVVDAVPTIVTPGVTPAEAFQVEARTAKRLADFDIVMMRKDPPVDIAYLHATWILEHARGKTLLVNDPRGLRELNEHLAVLWFPHLTPPTIVTRSPERLRAFQAEQGGAIVVKPVDGYGGLGIFVIRDGDPNASSIIETSTEAGRKWTLAQRYLPEVTAGDKRIVLVDGESVGAVLRVPAEAEARGNLHVGGRAVKTTIDARDQQIIAELAPFLRQHGQILVGLDVIGGMLTELNITSPTGIRHIARLENRNVAAPILERLEKMARALRSLACASAVAVTACAPLPRMVVPQSAGLAIGTVTLGISNVHVLFGSHIVLVDTGSPGEEYDLENGLHALGVKLSDVSCAVVTHVHADHAGGARALQRHGIKIIAGQGDVARATRGDHGTLYPTSFFARFLLKPLIPHRFEAFTPDVAVVDHYDLHDCGVDAEAIAMPGHTAGSLVVIAGGGKIALVGDLFRGGALAGYVQLSEPKEHFYQDDLVAAHQRIHELLARGIETFVLGHGGPSNRADVMRVFGEN